MKSKSFWKRLYLILIIILVIELIFLLAIYLGKKSNKSSEGYANIDETEKEYREDSTKRRYFSLSSRVKHFYSYIINSPITSVYIRVYELDNTYSDFFHVKNRNNTYISDLTKFLYSEDSVYLFPLVNVKFPFLNIKDNAYSYLHPLLAIKMLYIFDKVNFNPRLSDALREKEHQLKYKRRGWTNIEKSPHLIGLAFDISRYTWSEKKKIENLCDELSLYFLQHGGRSNMHIHIQDDNIWTRKSIVKNAFKTSEEFSNEYHQKESCFNIYKEQEVLSPNNTESTNNNLLNRDINKNIYSFKKELNTTEIIKLEIFNPLGIKIVELYTLMDNRSNNEFVVDFSFLAPGIYKLRFYDGNKFIREESLKIF